MQDSSLPDDLTLMSPSTNTPPPPFQPASAASLAPPLSLAYPPPAAYPPRPAAPPFAGPPAAKQHPTVSVQMSPRNLIIGGSVLAFLIIVIAAVALISGSAHTTPSVYSNAAFPGPNTGNSSTTTDANGNSVTMGPGAHAVQNPDGSTTTDSNGNTVTQVGSGNSTDSGANPQQSPFQGDSSFPQQQPQQQGGFSDQQQGYPQQQPQQDHPQQQQGGYNPQQTYPR